MKGTNLGELEELILLTVGVLYDDAYGVAIQDYLERECDRTATISTIHVVLHRLEEKGYLDSRLDGASSERGGRRKLLFTLTKSGKAAILEARAMRDQLWKAIPKAVFNYAS